jgi:hypothetical protein
MNCHKHKLPSASFVVLYSTGYMGRVLGSGHPRDCTVLCCTILVYRSYVNEVSVLAVLALGLILLLLLRVCRLPGRLAAVELLDDLGVDPVELLLGEDAQQ